MSSSVTRQPIAVETNPKQTSASAVNQPSVKSIPIPSTQTNPIVSTTGLPATVVGPKISFIPPTPVAGTPPPITASTPPSITHPNVTTTSGVTNKVPLSTSTTMNNNVESSNNKFNNNNVVVPQGKTGTGDMSSTNTNKASTGSVSFAPTGNNTVTGSVPPPKPERNPPVDPQRTSGYVQNVSAASVTTTSNAPGTVGTTTNASSINSSSGIKAASTNSASGTNMINSVPMATNKNASPQNSAASTTTNSTSINSTVIGISSGASTATVTSASTTGSSSTPIASAVASHQSPVTRNESVEKKGHDAIQKGSSIDNTKPMGESASRPASITTSTVTVSRPMTGVNSGSSAAKPSAGGAGDAEKASEKVSHESRSTTAGKAVATRVTGPRAASAKSSTATKTTTKSKLSSPESGASPSTNGHLSKPQRTQSARPSSDLYERLSRPTTSSALKGVAANSTTPDTVVPPRTKSANYRQSTRMGDAGGDGKPATLNSQFAVFSKFGDTSSDGKSISLTNSDKWMKQAHVIDGKKITTTDTSISFKKLFKTAKKVGLDDYKKYIEELATTKKMESQEILNKLANCGTPGTSSATKASHGGVYDRLTDTSKYTGSHKERFDSSGKGRGLEGRRDTSDSSGYTHSFKSKLEGENKSPGT